MSVELPNISKIAFDQTLDNFFDEGMRDIEDHIARNPRLGAFISQTARNVEHIAAEQSPELLGRYVALQLAVLSLLILNGLREQSKQKGTEIDNLPLIDIRTARSVAADMNQDQNFHRQVLEQWCENNPNVLHLVVGFAETTKDPFSVIFACVALWKTLEKQLEVNKMNQQFDLGDLDLNL